MKPIQTLFFLVSVGILSFGLAIVMPNAGIDLGHDLTFRFASVEEDTLASSAIEKIVDVEAFLEELEIEIDSTAIKDAIRIAKIAERIRLSKIQWNNNNRSSMASLFEALEVTKSTKKTKVRIMHFGDSQIEGDRITGIIRSAIQKEYGGIGAGLVPPVEAVPNAAIKQTNSENWNRFTLFGRVDTNIDHKRYGPLCSFGMFTYPTDTAFTETRTAWVQFEPSKMTYFKTRKFNQVKMFYGHNSQAFIAKVIAGDSTEIDSRIVASNEGFGQLDWHFDTTPNKLRFEFLAKKSPEFYAFSFEGDYGVTVDNIGLRGSSGTLFKRLDGLQLKGFMQSQPIELIILQYGGNTVPYITTEEKAIKYGKWFKSQITYLMRINPNAAFIIIGPSDMATKVNGNYMTYPFLPSVRDALKTAAFESGAGYWDLYEVMGGKNAMISWVEAEKPLAAKDYIHFNNLGTRKVSELFMKAFWYEKQLWEQTQYPKETDTTHVN
ncbi:MAG: hypothetical protein ACI9GM_000132 [Salibacteraceae bacterium]|jgi:hypothetical protein